MFERITFDPAIQGGRACIRGMRISVSVIVRQMAHGASNEEILGLFDQFSPTPAGMGRRALAASTQPVGFELTMARKDVRLMIETAGDAKLVLLPAIAKVMDEAIAAGLGAEDFAIIATRS